MCFIGCCVSLLNSSGEKYGLSQSHRFISLFFLAKKGPSPTCVMTTKEGDRICKTMVLKKMTGIKFGLGLHYEKEPTHILFLLDCLHLNSAFPIQMLVW